MIPPLTPMLRIGYDGPGLPSRSAGRDGRIEVADHTLGGSCIQGHVVKDFEVLPQYAESWSRQFDKLEWPLGDRATTGPLSIFRVGRALVGPFCIPFDLDRSLAFSNHFYEDGAVLFPVRELVGAASFRHQVRSGPSLHGPMLVLGGPIDGNYYHWLLSWCSRLAIVQELAPGLLTNQDIRLLVDARANCSPYLDHLRSFGITDDRIVWANPFQDQEVRDALLVTLPSQNAYHPAVIGGLAKRLVDAAAAGERGRSRRRIWISREGLAPPKRRVTNFDAIEPVLKWFGIEVVSLERLNALQQIAIFTEAELVVGVHGAGLANLIFCAPDCRILILEKPFNVAVGLARTFTVLAQACKIAHEMLVVDVDVQPGVSYDSMFNAHHQDVVVSPEALTAALRRLRADSDHHAS